jgi:hypothetical protein
LRDNETVLELLTAISEETAKEMHRERDAHEAGAVGGATRRDIESRLGRSVVSLENAKALRQGRQAELQPPLLGTPAGEESE